MAVVGDPEYCVRRIETLRREYQMDEFICYFNQGGLMPHAMVRESMTRFAREVLPYCR
jgi:alkanesulfonate monooxygenase SsuD/methylene tetrahydromethanopterin reductase-like flavin-dependent oxidoreductase (luciferase family)